MRTKLFKNAILPLMIGAALAGCSEPKTQETAVADTEQMQKSVNEVVSEKSAKEINASAYDIATRAAKWQVAQFGNLSYIPESHREKSENPKFWIQAAFYIGLTKWLEVDKNPELFAYVENMAKEQNYELLVDRPYHADDHTIGQTYIWLTEQTGTKMPINPLNDILIGFWKTSQKLILSC
jgi:rhamnogalacturonyl hydrolase YesR